MSTPQESANRQTYNDQKEQLLKEKIDLKFKIHDHIEENIKLKTKITFLEKEMSRFEKILEDIGALNIQG